MDGTRRLGRGRPTWSRAVASCGLALVVAAVACGDDDLERCPVDLLPGICAGDPLPATVPALELTDGVLVDVDGDGEDEVVGVERGRPWLEIERSGGRVSLRPVEALEAIEAGDFDGDGRRDLALLTSAGALRIVAVVEVGAGALVDRAVVTVGGEARDLRAGDLDGDGRDDLVVVDPAAATISAIVGLEAAPISTSIDGAPVQVELGDLDGDGILDVVVADFVGSAVHALHGEGDGRFTPRGALASAVGVDSIALGDLDGDGDLDLAARGALGEVHVHRGDGAGGFAPAVVVEPGPFDGHGVAVLDAGDDGVGGVMLPDGDALSTWFVAPNDAIEGRMVLDADSPRRLVRAGASSAWLVFGRETVRVDRRVGLPPVEHGRDVDARASSFAAADAPGSDLLAVETRAAPEATGRWSSPGDFGVRMRSSCDLDGDGRRERIDLGIRRTAVTWRSGDDDSSHEVVDVTPAVITCADLDHEGRDALLFAPDADGRVGLARWDGAALKVESLDFVASTGQLRSLAAADLDGDGHLDLIVAERLAPLAVRYGRSPREFDEPVLVDPVGVAPIDDVREVQSGDLDGDGLPELVRTARGQVSVYLNLGDREWSAAGMTADDATILEGRLLVARDGAIHHVPIHHGPIAAGPIGAPEILADEPLFDEYHRLLAGGDLDGDGRGDLVVGFGRGAALHLARGDDLVRVHEVDAHVVLVGDLVGNGRADLFVDDIPFPTVLRGEGAP